MLRSKGLFFTCRELWSAVLQFSLQLSLCVLVDDLLGGGIAEHQVVDQLLFVLNLEVGMGRNGGNF